jgi:hypothetical protein
VEAIAPHYGRRSLRQTRCPETIAIVVQELAEVCQPPLINGVAPSMTQRAISALNEFEWVSQYDDQWNACTLCLFEQVSRFPETGTRYCQ